MRPRLTLELEAQNNAFRTAEQASWEACWGQWKTRHAALKCLHPDFHIGRTETLILFKPLLFGVSFTRSQISCPSYKKQKN